MTVPAVPEVCGTCGVEIPAGLAVYAFPDPDVTPDSDTGDPLDGPTLALCRDCTELNDQLDTGV